MVLKMKRLWILILICREWRVIINLNLLLLNSGGTKSWSDIQPGLLFSLCLMRNQNFVIKLSFCQFKILTYLKVFVFSSASFPMCKNLIYYYNWSFWLQSPSPICQINLCECLPWKINFPSGRSPIVPHCLKKSHFLSWSSQDFKFNLQLSQTYSLFLLYTNSTLLKLSWVLQRDQASS